MRPPPPYRSPSFPALPLALALAPLAALAACGGGDDLGGPGETGVIVVSSTTTGVSPDTDGYELLLDSAPAGTIASNGIVALTAVSEGAHRLALAPGSLAANCTAAVPGPVTVVVPPADTARVAIEVVCAARGSPPAVVSVVGPDVADNVPGAVTPFAVTFADPDGDVARLVVVAEFDPRNAVEPDSVEIDVRAPAGGRPTGTLEHEITCRAVSPDLCGAGPVRLRFTLVDAEGSASPPAVHAMAFGIGTSPAITSAEAPARSGTARGTRTRIRLGFDDPEGDVDLVRIRELSDPADVLEANGATIDLADQAGSATSGVVNVDFVCQVRPGDTCRPGAATIRLVLVDRESNTSQPRDVTLVFESGVGGGTAPVITRLDAPSRIGTSSGSVGTFLIDFADVDGDVTTLRIEEVSDPGSAFGGDVVLDVLAQTAGLDAGRIRLDLRCTVPAGQECAAGVVTLRFLLEDAQGLVGPPSEATIEFVSETAGTVAGAWNRGMEFETGPVDPGRHSARGDGRRIPRGARGGTGGK